MNDANRDNALAILLSRANAERDEAIAENIRLRETLKSIWAMVGYEEVPLGTHQIIVDLLHSISMKVYSTLEVKP
jgi:hypothetical protein